MVCNPHWSLVILTLTTRPTISKPNCSRQGSTICYINIYIWTSARYPHTYLDLIPSRLLPRARVAEDQNPKKAYLVSGTNSRASDLAAAAKAFKDVAKQNGGRYRRSQRVYHFISPLASTLEQTVAEEQGDWQALIDAGSQPLPAGCGPCIGLTG